MNSPQKIRLRRLNIRLSDQEWDKVHRLSADTTCRSVSDYARKVLLNHPVKVFYRNQSFDNFEEQMIRLLPLLEANTGNFGQLVKKIDSMKNIPEIKAELLLVQIFWEALSDTEKEIKTHIEKLSDHATKNNAL